jgi:hypothetical protein
MSRRVDPITGRCEVCQHIARHVLTNVWHCDDCDGPCLTEEGRAREASYPKPWDKRKP